MPLPVDYGALAISLYSVRLYTMLTFFIKFYNFLTTLVATLQW
jgi:hypothetical protein